MSFMINRRRFLQTASASLALSTLGARGLDIVHQKPKRVGLIGTGWYGKNDLFRRPASSRMHSDIEMDNLPSMMTKNNEAVQYLEPDSRHCEEINASDLFDVVSQKSHPYL